MKIKYFEKIIWLFVTIISITSLYYLLRDFNKGFDFTDESWYLLSYEYPLEATNSYSLFNLVGTLFYKISGQNIVNLRYLSFAILILSSLLLAISFKYNRSDYFYFFKHSRVNFVLIIVAILSSSLLYSRFSATPGYNYFNLLFLIYYCITINLFFSKNLDSKLVYFLFSVLIFLISAIKITTGLLVLFLSIIILKKKLLEFIKIFLPTLSIFFILYYIFFSEHFYYVLKVVNEIFFSLEASSEISHHSFKKIFIKPLLPLGYLTLTNKMLIATFVLTIFSYIKKKEYNFIFCFLVIIFLILKDKNLPIFGFYMLIYNIFLYHFIKKDFKFLAYSLVLFIGLFLSFSFGFGTNNRLDYMINLSSVLIIIPIFLILVSEIRNKYLKNIFSLVFVSGLSLMIFEISIDRNNKPYRINYKTNNHKYEINSMYNKNLFKNLKVDIDTHNFIKDFENELKINDWEINNYLIDISLKSPGILVLAHAKFIKYPWYIREKHLLFNSLNELQNFENVWFLSMKLNNNKDEELFNQIDDKYLTSEYENSEIVQQKRKFWYHKNIDLRNWYFKKPKN